MKRVNIINNALGMLRGFVIKTFSSKVSGKVLTLISEVDNVENPDRSKYGAIVDEINRLVEMTGETHLLVKFYALLKFFRKLEETGEIEIELLDVHILKEKYADVMDIIEGHRGSLERLTIQLNQLQQQNQMGQMGYGAGSAYTTGMRQSSLVGMKTSAVDNLYDLLTQELSKVYSDVPVSYGVEYIDALLEVVRLMMVLKLTTYVDNRPAVLTDIERHLFTIFKINKSLFYRCSGSLSRPTTPEMYDQAVNEFIHWVLIKL
jgi:hypothetical protein